MAGSAIILIIFESLSYELFFVLSLIGFIVMIEFTSPIAVSPVWRTRLRWILILGLIIFAYIIGVEILDSIPDGVF